jgi:hypothetical protein
MMTITLCAGGGGVVDVLGGGVGVVVVGVGDGLHVFFPWPHVAALPVSERGLAGLLAMP